MNTSLQKPRLAMVKPSQVIFTNNIRQKHIRKKWKFILKILSYLKRETNYIQLNGGQYIKL